MVDLCGMWDYETDVLMTLLVLLATGVYMAGEPCTGIAMGVFFFFARRYRHIRHGLFSVSQSREECKTFCESMSLQICYEMLLS